MFRLLIACTASLVLLSVRAAAQDASPPLPASGPPPANLAFVDGAVDVVHEGLSERATAGTMLLDGDAVRTANGRAEVVFADGTLLHVDHDTDLEVLSPTRLRLREGRLLVRVSPAATAPYAIDTPAASVHLQSRGEYGVSANGRFERLEVTVARGIAEVDERGARTLVRAGEMATLLGAGGRLLLQPFNSARFGAFEQWASDRANGFTATHSSRQLPLELRPYGPLLDHHGRWDYLDPYGYVWFPAVGVNWRPYFTGAWRLTRYGYTWFGHDPWSWPTHHYGRWGFTGAAWYWIPNRVWGPAWVSFNFVSNYVSWCPLGWDGRPVFSLYGGGRAGDHPDFRPSVDPWRGWTVAPRDAFGARRAVPTYAVDPRRLPEDTRRSMSNAVPRGVAPVPSVGAGVVTPAPSRSISGANGRAIRGYAVPREAIAPPQPDTVTHPANRGAFASDPRPAGPASVARPGSVRAPDDAHTQSPGGYAPGVARPTVQLPPTQTARPDAAAVDGPRTEPTEPRIYAPGMYRRPDVARPRRDDAASRDDRPTRSGPARSDPARSEPARQPAPPPRAEPQRGADRSPSQNGRSSGVAVTRPGRQESQGQSGQHGSGTSNGGASGGAARRRPG